MRRYISLLLFIGFAFWSCEEDEPEDCAGVAGGSAVLDNCNVCDDNPENDCLQDCADAWGGSALLDSCGVCDADPSNDCAEDCAGIWGGSAVLDNCDVCDDDPANDCAEDCAGVWGGNNICGCTDNTAFNYNLDATFDDGSCFYCGVDTSFSRVLTGTAGYDIIRSSSCSYVISGSDGKTILLKIDELGNEIWSRSYSEISGNHWGNSVSQTDDGGYIIGANQSTIIKTDSTGLLQWYYKLPYSNPYYVEDVIQTFAGDYIVVGGVGGDPSTSGHNQRGQAFILRMSEGGGVQWVKRYGISNTPNDSFWGVVQADDGGFVLAGEKLQDRNFEFYDHFWIVKTDGNGDMEWSHELGGNLWDEALDIVKLSDDSYILAGKKSLSSSNLDMWVMRISSDGSVLWQANHGNNNYETATSLTLSENEDIVAVVGYTRSSSSNPFKYRIWGVDVATGQVIWNKIHGGNQEDKAYGVVESYDQGFNMVGRSYSFGSERVNWLVKTNSSGNIY